MALYGGKEQQMNDKSKEVSSQVVEFWEEGGHHFKSTFAFCPWDPGLFSQLREDWFFTCRLTLNQLLGCDVNSWWELQQAEGNRGPRLPDLLSEAGMFAWDVKWGEGHTFMIHERHAPDTGPQARALCRHRPLLGMAQSVPSVSAPFPAQLSDPCAPRVIPNCWCSQLTVCLFLTLPSQSSFLSLGLGPVDGV